LHQRVAGDAIESVWLGAKPADYEVAAAEIATTLETHPHRPVRRMGKHIVFELERNGLERVSGRAGGARSSPAKSRKRQPDQGSNSQWIVHLGMTGRMLVVNRTLRSFKHTHAIVKLASGRELRFVDPAPLRAPQCCSEG